MGKLVRAIVLISFAFLISACGGSGGDSGGAIDLHATPPGELLQSDLQGLQDLDQNSFQSYDRDHDNTFSAIFGGNTISDVENYLNARVHYYALENDVNILHGHKISSTGLSDNGAQIIALNMGTALWMESLLEGVSVSFTVRGQVDQPVEVDDSRVGLVVLADGYTDKALYQGQIVTLPPIFRQQTLMHEARHSDCTGGLHTSDLPGLKAAEAANDSSRVWSAMHGCGHVHVICPSGDYKGLPACDNESWGAYQVGAVFAEASVSPDSDATAWNIAQALAQDSRSRLLVAVSGKPDMTSAGLVGN